MPANVLGRLNEELRNEAARRLGIRVTGPVVAPGLERAEAAAAPVRVELVGALPPGMPRFGYEAIVERFGRPSLLVQQGTFELAQAEFWRARLESNRAKLERAIQSVGRVELENHRASWLGTAWMVAPRVAVTNRHVALEFTDVQDGTFRIGRNPLGREYAVYVNFAAEHLQPSRRRVKVSRVLYVSPLLSAEPDMALLELEGDDVPPPIPLSQTAPEGKREIAVVGYPAYDYRNDAADQARIFGDVYGVKRLAPGEVDLPGDGVFEHDATTLGGSSGSVVLDLETGAAVGLHFAGEYLRANYAVTAPVLRERLGGLAEPRAPAPLAPPRPSLDAPEAEIPRNLDERDGYAPAFLAGFEVPLPDYGALVPVAAPLLADPTKHLLDYTHFSVVMHKQRRLALFTATNIDGEQALAIKRKGPEQWYFDPRIDRGHQVGNDLYAGNDLDRGHLTRRLDPAWGEHGDAGQAERDTFFWTNCTPQHAAFNQRIWLGLEDYILENAVTVGFRASVFTGPVLSKHDPEYRGVRLPRAFWKVAVTVAKPARLSATGYVVSQASLLTDLEFAYGEYKTYQVPLATIERLTGLRFPALKRADPLGSREGVGAGRELGDLGDVEL